MRQSKKMRQLLSVVILCVAGGLTVTGCSMSSVDPAVSDLRLDLSEPPVRIDDIAGVNRNLFRDGRVYIAGQPDQAALARFRELGVTAVVNVRTPNEMENPEVVSFDEAGLVGELGMEYRHIPLGGADHPYTSQAVEELATVLRRHEGPVLLHCGMAGRAAYLWVAYLVRYQGMELHQAMQRGEAIAISPSPLAGLLERPLRLVFAE